ncbi:pyridoxine 5'-phosphate synthase [Mesohalobacter halotolerans]|uniref:Pyridoxine 5'-phosphate synthase n=1 Tax=Mesohalobacter halotolerans TaxID=1883405 RepID=A0A4U5TPU1_9FLAO|nr:pyridoxine 5'-phosphate synthase [Mesohalobacter halotolerans]MBS3737628.1 pyridoxine 5'-phosphate synthase [Psychroflexus sp.]TKS55458.1 pyridoxine 5'-phosphate synthase [Mesohalobacter halotolerans]
MTRLSVNINKIATLRNARGGNMPNVLQSAIDIEGFGAQGITVHPRPDERHIRYDDVRALSKSVTTEFNVEGNPTAKFIDLVLETKPDQVTLVPDAEDAITSNAGWDTRKHHQYLKEIIQVFQKENIRTSIFVDSNPEMVKYAKNTNTDRVELYTEAYAKKYKNNKKDAIKDFLKAAQMANTLNIELNAGHDLNLENIEYFAQKIPNLKEVSIGHALICEALYHGLEHVIQSYIKKLQ